MAQARRVEAEVNNPQPGALLLVGRDPGENEVVVGRPFVGKAGEVLDRTLALAGLRRQDVNITNRVPWRPPGNDFERHERWHVAQGLVELDELIDELKPGLVLAMGNEANYNLVDKWPGESIFDAKGILDLRGFFWPEYRNSPVMSTIHPALVTYQAMPNKMLLEIDMLRVREYMMGNLPRVDVPKPKIASHPNDVMELFSNELVAFDIETKWDNEHLRCIAFYGEKMKRPLVYLARDFDWCVPFLECDVPKVAHNGQYDTYWLKYKGGIEVDAFEHDTSILHWATYLELAGKTETGGEGRTEFKGGMTRKSLLFLASQHLNVPYWKEYTDDELRMAELCGQDVFVTRKLWDIMIEDARAAGVIGQYRDAINRIPFLNHMQARGLRIDEGLRKERLKELTERQSRLEEESREAGLEYITEHEVERYRWTKQCKCCGGGEKKSQHCWSCAGFDRSPTKTMWREWIKKSMANREITLNYGSTLLKQLKEMKANEVGPEWLAPCEVCGGEGTTSGFDFNPMSPQQLGELLFEELDVPRSVLRKRDKIVADEDTIKRVHEWSMK